MSDADPAPHPPEHQVERPVATARWWTLAVFVAVSIGRYAFTSDRRVWHISPDEPSQLAIARWLAGGRWNMFDHATWQPLLGTLLTPIYWFTDDGTTAVRVALGVNSVIGGAGAAVLVVVVRHLTRLAPVASALIALIVGLAPSSMSASSFVWAEPLVALTFLVTILALLRYHDDDEFRWAVVAVVTAIVGYTAHSRLLPFVATTALLTVGWEAWKRRPQRFSVLAFVTGVLLLVSAWWKDWLLRRIWDDPSNQNTVGSVWDRFQKPLGVADAVLGQFWYQLAATLGLFAFGSVVVLRSLRGPKPDAGRNIGPDRLAPSHARILAVSIVPLLGLSAVFMSDRPRPDQQIYGRYNDALVWPVVAIGIAWLARRAIAGFARRDLVMAIGTVVVLIATGLTVDHLHGDEIRESYGVRSMIPGLLPFVDADDVLDVARTTLVAAALTVAILLAVRLVAERRLPEIGRGAVAVLAGTGVVVLLAVATLRLETVADLRLNGWEPTSEVAEVDDLVPPGAPLAVKTVRNGDDPAAEYIPQRQRYQLYQLWLPERTFLRDRGVGDDVGPYVFAPLEDPELTDAGADVIWRDPRVRIGLYVEP